MHVAKQPRQEYGLGALEATGHSAHFVVVRVSVYVARASAWVLGYPPGDHTELAQDVLEEKHK
jgi:hypothetical protein